MHGIHAFTHIFDHDITNVVDDVSIVARTADQRIGAGSAIQRIGGAVAGQDIGQGIARRIECRHSGQRQVLDVGGERVVNARQHQIGPGARGLGHHVRDIVNDVSVVTQAAHHRVGACAAVQHVGGAIAGQLVVQRVAHAIERGGAGQQQIFHVRAEGVADT